MLDKRSGTPLHAQLTDLLRTEIHGGELPPYYTIAVRARAVRATRSEPNPHCTDIDAGARLVNELWEAVSIQDKGTDK